MKPTRKVVRIEHADPPYIPTTVVTEAETALDWVVLCEGDCGLKMVSAKWTYRPVDPADETQGYVKVVQSGPAARCCGLCGPEHFAKCARPAVMSCPRQCGVDMRNHHSTDLVNGGCDTGPMSLDDLHAWFALRTYDHSDIAELVAEHYGKTQDELDRLYEALHGQMA